MKIHSIYFYHSEFYQLACGQKYIEDWPDLQLGFKKHKLETWTWSNCGWSDCPPYVGIVHFCDKAEDLTCISCAKIIIKDLCRLCQCNIRDPLIAADWFEEKGAKDNILKPLRILGNLIRNKK